MSSSTRTTSIRPRSQAQCNGVMPSWSAWKARPGDARSMA
eukprot:CAMPEP_0175743254 /NCGR_PEP_ID=MMETSP0097-20121207/56947_1 /TAXON_ID=311494 /ORGANISM="Alexandrium monilatum, Strain CCMP3105" /LENGTH=39 /DNA_ID= /DNA_START= /DNA_END= /DNA_ORIENTATION=